MNKRIDMIDALKGLAILLVVFGHAIQSSTAAFDENVFFRIIYSFHMPLFMFLSGMVASYSFDIPLIPYLQKKFMALVVPFSAWYALAYFANGSYQTISLFGYIGRVMLSPDWGLWFLWVLFLNYCFLVFAVKMEKGIGLLAFLVAVLFVEWIPFGFLGLGLSKVHFVYFTIGYLVMKYKDALKKYFMLVQLFSLISFPILVSQWHRTKGFSFLRQVDNFFGSLSVVFVPQLIIYGCVILLALSGIVISYMIIQYVIKNTVFYKYFCKLGNYTLDIYVSHIYFLYGIGIGLTKVFSSVFVAIFASLAIAILILRRIQILNLFFLGGRIRIANKINSRIVAESVIA